MMDQILNESFLIDQKREQFLDSSKQEIATSAAKFTELSQEISTAFSKLKTNLTISAQKIAAIQ